MTDGRIAELPRRGVVAVSGRRPTRFLDNLMTANVGDAGAGAALFGGLLTPQGKVLFDFIVFRDGERYLLDLPRERGRRFRQAARLLPAARQGDDRRSVRRADRRRRLGRRQRPDPRRHRRRRSAPCRRSAGAASSRPAPTWRPTSPNRREADYDAHRIALGVPEGGIDFAFGEPSRTTPTWTSSAASISPRAAMSARRSSRAWSIAARRGAASSSRRGSDPAAGRHAGRPPAARPIGTLGSSAGGDRPRAGPPRPGEGGDGRRRADHRRRRAADAVDSRLGRLRLAADGRTGMAERRRIGETDGQPKPRCARCPTVRDPAPRLAAHAVRAAGSTCSTPRRSTSRSTTSPTGWRASRAGTARRSASTPSRSRSTRCWSTTSPRHRAGDRAPAGAWR